MMKRQYKDGLAEIAVSPELIDRTKLLMRRKRDGAPKRTRMVRSASAAACLAVVLFAVLAAPKWMNRPPFRGAASTAAALANGSPAREAAAADVAPSIPMPPSPRPGTASSGRQAADKGPAIYVNQLGDMIGQPPRGSGPLITGREKWTFQQYCDLLGFDPLPTVIPEGLRLIENDMKDRYFIYFQHGSRMDFYNTWSFVYTSDSEGNAKSLTVHVNPSFIPYWSVPRAYQLKDEVQITDVKALLRLGEKSEINGTEVTIWYKDKGSVWDYMGGDHVGKPLEVTDYYCADFRYKNAGLTVTAQNGITRAEFVRVLESMIQ